MASVSLTRRGGDLPLIFFDCSGPHDAPVPVHTQEDVEDPILALGSIGERLWSFERVPEDVRRLGVY